MSKREHITIIKPWQVTAGEHTGKWFAGVQWTEGVDQRYRHIDCPRSTFHEAQRDADALSRKIEAEGMQVDYPPLVTSGTFYSNEHQVVILEWLEANCGIHAQNLSDAVDLIERLMMASRPPVTTQAREQADVAEVLRALGPPVQSFVGVEVLDLPKVRETIDELKAQRDAAEQQISDAIEALHAHGIPVEDGMVASITALAKAWRLLSETHNAMIQESIEAQAKAEKERDEAQADARHWEGVSLIFSERCVVLSRRLEVARKGASD